MKLSILRIGKIIAVTGIIILVLIVFLYQKTEKKNIFLNKKEEKNMRTPAVAGQFYPAQKEELEEKIIQFFKKAKPQEGQGTIFALVLPHAGYDFSGPVAAYGYKALLKNFEKNLDDEKTIILIGPSHYFPIQKVILEGKDSWQTPLGEVQVDKKLVEFLVKTSPLFEKNSLPHQPEHSLEVQVPFLQKIFPHFKILPILVNELDASEREKVSEILASLADEKTIFIASSDMSHYPSYQDANYLDKKVIEAILTGKVEELEKTIKELEEENIPNTLTFLCGEESVKLVMKIGEKLGVKQIQLLHYANSGDVFLGDKRKVVGYGAIAFLKEEEDNFIHLSQEEKKTLLTIARQTVESYIQTGKIPEFEITSPVLNKKLGAFVTIKKKGQLRGCLGVFSPSQLPLYQVVAQMAKAAATEDNRFFPVQKDELKDLSYEISVLSPLKKIDDWRKIEVGKHGVEIRYGLKRGVFLPQVAREQNWDLETFLSMLCWEKLGLPPACYQNKEAEIFVFTAEVFSEEEVQREKLNSN
jgi:AmmeMemoRadiSam system protein B/AmmeMemoRadiSam system protein A